MTDTPLQTINEKHTALVDLLRDMDSVLVAFSGGADSTLLAAVAHNVLGGRAAAVTAVSHTYPDREHRDAVNAARHIGIDHHVVKTCEGEDERFSANPPERCYYCKLELYSVLENLQQQLGAAVIIDGTTTDDFSDYRPGMRATRERGVRSPLAEAGFSKEDVRMLSRSLGLPTAEKEAQPCLASRIPYGTPITAERLQAIETAENILRAAGFTRCRVRHHGAVARIEVDPDDIPRFADPSLRQQIMQKIQQAGFTWVALDLGGYRMGSMNEALEDTR